MVKSISGFCQNLNSFRGMSFYHSAGIINNIFENILILLLKMKI